MACVGEMGRSVRSRRRRMARRRLARSRGVVAPTDPPRPNTSSWQERIAELCPNSPNDWHLLHQPEKERFWRREDS